MCGLISSVLLDLFDLLNTENVEMKKETRLKRRAAVTDKTAAKETNLACSFLLTECLNCTSFTDMSSRIDAIESKVTMLPGTHLYQPEV